jgi:hypothetical protein
LVLKNFILPYITKNKKVIVGVAESNCLFDAFLASGDEIFIEVGIDRLTNFEPHMKARRWSYRVPKNLDRLGNSITVIRRCVEVGDVKTVKRNRKDLPPVLMDNITKVIAERFDVEGLFSRHPEAVMCQVQIQMEGDCEVCVRVTANRTHRFHEEDVDDNVKVFIDESIALEDIREILIKLVEMLMGDEYKNCIMLAQFAKKNLPKFKREARGHEQFLVSMLE